MRWPTLLACCLAGCTAALPPPWTKPDATDADMRAALNTCRAQASRQPLTPRAAPPHDRSDPNAAGPNAAGASAEDMATYRRHVNDCMASAGWSHRE
ncbi:MAG TPA: hypothetical protein VJ743_09615 [Albitalea sp.]|nr:hypothetical protein [Albitalea sp.]